MSTWPAEAWKQGGGTVWGWISYDPELNLIYYGTSNPGPWNSSMRPGDNLWTAGVFARDADTGAARWFYQWSPPVRFAMGCVALAGSTAAAELRVCADPNNLPFSNERRDGFENEIVALIA